MANEIDPMQSVRWPSRKRRTIGHDTVDLILDFCKAYAAKREEERRLEPVRRLQQAQAELKGALVGIRTAGILAGAMCADTPEKRQAVIREADELCLVIRGDQMIDVPVPAPQDTMPSLSSLKKIGRHTSRQKFTTKMEKAYLEYEGLLDNGANLSKGNQSWFPIYKIAFGFDPAIESGDTPQRIKLRRTFNREYKRYLKESA
jgi:hypothetical protein